MVKMQTMTIMHETAESALNDKSPGSRFILSTHEEALKLKGKPAVSLFSGYMAWYESPMYACVESIPGWVYKEGDKALWAVATTNINPDTKKLTPIPNNGHEK